MSSAHCSVEQADKQRLAVPIRYLISTRHAWVVLHDLRLGGTSSLSASKPAGREEYTSCPSSPSWVDQHNSCESLDSAVRSYKGQGSPLRYQVEKRVVMVQACHARFSTHRSM